MAEADRRRRRAVAAALAVAGVAGLAAVVAGSGLAPLVRAATSLSPEDIERFAERAGAWGPAAAVLLMVLHSFLPLPGEVIAIASGMCFGTAGGIAVTWTGAMLGAALSYGLARRFGRPVLRSLVPARHRAWLELKPASAGTLLILRLVPAVSFNLVNYLAGLAAVPWRRFLWTTGLGILPLTVLSVVAGRMLMAASWELLAAGSLALLALWLAGRRAARRLLDSQRR